MLEIGESTDKKKKQNPRKCTDRTRKFVGSNGEHKKHEKRFA